MNGLRHPYTSPLRYPGGKGALSNFVKLLFERNNLLDGHYAEVYAGSAAIAWGLLFEEYVRHVHVNDIDNALLAFWASVLYQTDDLCRLIQDTPVTITEWNRQRAVLAHPNDHTTIELGFATFFLNRTNRSGIISGGVIGGQAQTGRWSLDARYNKPDLIARVIRIASFADRVSLYNLDAIEFLKRSIVALPQKALVYLDPPYYSKGEDLYEHHYSHDDHVAIAMLIARVQSHSWLVTYDAVPPVLRLYRGFRQLKYKISYSAQDRYTGSEVMFLSPGLDFPAMKKTSRITSRALRPAAHIQSSPHRKGNR